MPLKEFVKLIALGLGLLFLFSGCAPDAAALEATVVAQAQENIVQTVAALPAVTHQPTYTAEPTYTVQPTYTPQPPLSEQPTLTPQPTYTLLPTYTPQPTYTDTPPPTNTSLPVNTPTPVPPTSSPTDQFTAAGVQLTKSYMAWFPGAYFRCLAQSSLSCLNPSYSLDCLQFVSNFNNIVARQNLAPQNAEEPIRTAAAIYTATVQEYITILTPQAAYCQEQINLGRTEIDSRELGSSVAGQLHGLLGQLDQAITILQQVEAGNA
jgi:hypothetical protein